MIDQKRKVPSDFADTQMRIFEDELLEVQRLTNKMIDFALQDEAPSACLLVKLTAFSRSAI